MVPLSRHHTEWLSLVPVSGPFLSLPVLLEAFNTGLEPHDPEHVRLLRQEYANWLESFEKRKADPAAHHDWVKFVLNQTLDLDDRVLLAGQAISQTLHVEVPEHHELLRPNFVVSDPGDKKPRLLVQVYPRSQPLASYVANSPWKASPDTRMTELLHGAGVQLGLVTNGEHWMLVNAPKGETTGYASWYASLWLEEPITLRAFRGLLSAGRFFNVPDDQTLEALLAKSAANQQEVTDQLGYQVRRAVEVLIHSLDRADQDFGRKLLADVTPERLYESALTVMMRLVFLFCAEERELIPSKPFPVYEQNYSVSTISKQLRELADQHGEELLERRHDAWPRLLAAFRAVHAGLKHDDVHIPAYGGNLFNPDRFPFLEGRRRGTTWKEVEANPLPVNNRTVLHLLEALQLLRIKTPGGGPAEARRLSFRALDIEQIGHVYEGLLDHTARRAAEPYLGLAGTRDKEPEIRLAKLEELLAKDEAELVKFLKGVTGRSESALKKALRAELDDHLVSRFRTACQDFGAEPASKRARPTAASIPPVPSGEGALPLWQCVKPFAGLIRLDTTDYPVVILPGSVFVTAGTDRRSSGTHYTPRSLTEPIVQYTLEPLVYVGPAEGLPKEQWTLRPARELLELKICDMACGSGAFLVQAARYMAERLLEAWEITTDRGTTNNTNNTNSIKGERAEPLVLNPVTGEVLPASALTSTPSTSSSSSPSSYSSDSCYSWFLPLDRDERRTYALRIVAQRCLYGVDKNPLAVEMAKLSLWLLTLAKDKPFTFVDHSIRPGDSLVGLETVEQLLRFSLDERVSTGPLLEQQRQQIENRLNAVKLLRRQIEEQPSNTHEDIERKTLMLKNADEQTRRLTYAADLLLAASWRPMSAAERELALNATLVEVEYKFKDVAIEELDRAAQARLREAGVTGRFHWPLEFPEVFERGGFDAFVGNPPFLGGTRIRGTHGLGYLEFLQRSWGKGNSADLCTYFFRRAVRVLTNDGTLGLLATNSVAQGDSRSFGLDRLIQDGCVIHRAIASRKWPGAASLEVSHVWCRKGNWVPLRSLDDKLVAGITSALTESGTTDRDPLRLIANSNSSFLGSYVLGMGFVLAPDEARTILAQNAKNGDVLFEYLSGDDITSRPDQSASRWVVNFFDWPLDRNSAPAGYVGPVAADYPDCLRLIEERVKPERTRTNEKGEHALRRPLPQRWWIYADKRPALYARIKGMRQVLVASRVSAHHFFSLSAVGKVFSDRLVVISEESYGSFALLSSSIHDLWAHRPGTTTHETRNTYFPETAYETFPYCCCVDSTIEEVGRKYYEVRDASMRSSGIGLRDTYNRFHDPGETSSDIQTLRDLHLEMDRAVAGAYGWTDLELGHGFHETKQGLRFTISESARREVLARLLALNHQRHAEEVRQGLHEKKRVKKTAKGGRKHPVAPLALFSDDAIDVAFPSSEHERLQCAVLLDLVHRVPGLPVTAYLDTLLLTMKPSDCATMLIGGDRDRFKRSAKRAQKDLVGGESPNPAWPRIRQSLLANCSLAENESGGVTTFVVGGSFDVVRACYPAIDGEFLELANKAGERFREIIATVSPSDVNAAGAARRTVELREAAIQG